MLKEFRNIPREVSQARVYDSKMTDFETENTKIILAKEEEITMEDHEVRLVKIQRLNRKYPEMHKIEVIAKNTSLH